MYLPKWLLALCLVALTATVTASGGFDFGLFRDQLMNAQSEQFWGVVEPVQASSTDSVDANTAESDPTTLVTLAKGLHARALSANQTTAPNIDQMAFWPNDQNPTHLIACNEQGTSEPGLQRIRLSDGLAETIMTGTESCDPVRRTPWGTIIFGEENGTSSWMIELIHPLATSNVFFDRSTGVFSGGTGAGNLSVLRALGHLSFEGLALYPNGVLYYGDENRPANGTPGGAYFKFIPSTPWTGGVVSDLSQSPLVAGTIYGLRLGKRNGNTDFGQGTNTGQGTWIPINPSFDANLRAVAASLKLTGYYRPEDLEVDPSALAKGLVRFCGNNTGNEGSDRQWGETICMTDGTVAQATANTATPEVQYFVIGSHDFAMMDNLAYQPGRGNWIIHEDGDGPEVGRNNDLWSCLPDGKDVDTLSDGCVRVGTLNDLTSEWTGGIFNKAGTHFYVSVQHNIIGHGVVLDITGWH